MPPCGLHLILAHHRYLYKFMYDVINKRNMDERIPEALRKIGCGYLAYQIEQYFKRLIFLLIVLFYTVFHLNEKTHFTVVTMKQFFF